MVEGTLIRSHIGEFIALINDMKTVEAMVEDQDQAILLLCSLLPSYKTFREMMIYKWKSLTFNDVKDNLLSKEKLDNDFGSIRTSKELALSLVGTGQHNQGIG